MHASESTHKQGEGLLVLGNLVFGQRIGLYANAKVFVSEGGQIPGSLAPQSGGMFES